MNTKRRPYIIQNFKGDRRQVTASSCRDLLSSGCSLFGIPRTDASLVLDDGTEIDDEYLATCGDYTVFTVLKSSETIKYIPQKAKELVSHFTRLLSSNPKEVTAALEHCKAQLIEQMLGNIESLEVPEHVLLSDSKKEDPNWFEGEKRATSKKRVMRERAKTRIKGYFYKSKDDLQRSVPENGKQCAGQLFQEFLALLRANDHNGHYFVRGEEKALCSETGQFVCQGTFSKSSCNSLVHRINPYGSREQLVCFSTWNLDHRVERSRSILPAIGEAIKEANGRILNASYFYKLLFTTDNLKLVHPVCHIKSVHEGFECERAHWYVDNGGSCGDSGKTVWKNHSVRSSGD
ncbi:unnamed protein product [Ixodes hexagonus]